MRCRKGYEVIPMKSPIGYYMGTVDEEGYPNCQISSEYAKTEEQARELPLDRQYCEENRLCNGSCGCFDESKEDDVLSAFDSVMEDKQDFSSMSTLQILDYIALEICKECKSYFAFKGGYTLMKTINEPRATQDIDISVQVLESYEEFKRVLENIGNKFLSEGLISRYELKPTVTEHSSGGIKFYDLSGKVLAGVDIGLHQLMSGIGKVDFKFAEVNAFTPERMISDKICSTLSRKRFRRVKDFYDIYCLCYTYNLDYKSLYDLVNLRLEDKSLWDNIPFNDVIVTELQHAWDKLSLVSCITNEELSKPNLSDVLGCYYKLTTSIKAGETCSTWDRVHMVWR